MDIQPPKGYKFTEDEEQKMLVIQGLKERDGHCPCEIRKTKENKCLCKIFKEVGVCRCGLFVKE